MNSKQLIVLVGLSVVAACSTTPNRVVSKLSGQDCSIIQEMINRAPAAKGGMTKVVVPPGNYICREPVIIDRSNLEVVGKGVKLTLDNNANAPVIIIGSQHTKWMEHPKTKKLDFYTVDAYGSDRIKIVRDIHVSGFVVDGNKDNQRYECWTKNGAPREPGQGIENTTCSGDGPSAIRNNGITIRGADDVKVWDVVLNNNASGGMVTEKYVRNLRVDRMLARDNWFDGFAGYQTEDSVIADSQLVHNQGAGASLDLEFNNNTFLRTKLSHNAHQGVFARQLHGNKWVDSEIIDNGYQGIFAATSHWQKVNTPEMRIYAREKNFRIERDLTIHPKFFEHLIKEPNERTNGFFQRDEIVKRAEAERKQPEHVLREMYMADIAGKRLLCANANSFINTKISGSGKEKAELGAGLRVNDDECVDNCVDDKSVEYMKSLSGENANRQGNVTLGTLTGDVFEQNRVRCKAGAR